MPITFNPRTQKYENIEYSSLQQRMIQNYIYFYHLDKFCVLPLWPEQVSDSMKTTFQQTSSLARSAPVFTFSNSGPRDITVNFTLHRDLLNDVNRSNTNFKKPDSKIVPYTGSSDDFADLLINYIQASAVPRYKNYSSGSKSVIPPMIAIRFGDDIFIKGVINGGVTLAYRKPIITIKKDLDGNTKQKYALIDISFTVSEVDPYDADKIVQQGGFRGLCATNDIFSNIDSDGYGNDNFPRGSNVVESDIGYTTSITDSDGDKKKQRKKAETAVTQAIDTIVSALTSGSQPVGTSGAQSVSRGTPTWYTFSEK